MCILLKDKWGQANMGRSGYKAGGF